jgi:VIT1/CCC1 family predicted Fe2+/Mn2+ transporter
LTTLLYIIVILAIILSAILGYNTGRSIEKHYWMAIIVGFTKQFLNKDNDKE